MGLWSEIKQTLGSIFGREAKDRQEEDDYDDELAGATALEAFRSGQVTIGTRDEQGRIKIEKLDPK